MLAARASLQRQRLEGHRLKGPCRARVRTCGRRLCGPSGTVLTHCARGRPVLSSSTHWRFPEKATSAGAPHRPHTHLAPGRDPHPYHNLSKAQTCSLIAHAAAGVPRP